MCFCYKQAKSHCATSWTCCFPTHCQVPERFIEVSEVALREFYSAIWTGRDSDPCWKKGIYKIICKLDSPVPDAFRLPGCPVGWCGCMRGGSNRKKRDLSFDLNWPVESFVSSHCYCYVWIIKGSLWGFRKEHTFFFLRVTWLTWHTCYCFKSLVTAFIKGGTRCSIKMDCELKSSWHM